MSEDSMTPRERWLAVLKRKEPDRVPVDYWATDEVTASLMAHFGFNHIKQLYQHLHIDRGISVKPEYIGTNIPEDMDVFGCRYRDVDYGTGSYRECVYHPLAEYKSVEEIDRNYDWPETSLYDYSSIPDQEEEWSDYPIEGGGSEPFLDYKNLRGQEQAFIDLFVNPEIVHYCLDKMFDFCYENTEKIYEMVPGKVTFSYVAEDFGSQTGLLMSPRLIKEYMIPRMKRMNALAHRNSVYVFFHSDGAIREIIPDMINIGIDILNPIQWNCQGMERERLKQDFGDKVVFHGGMDNQHTIPFGTIEEVRQEVNDNLEILGRNGGYILASCHNIQPVTPINNILTLYDEAYKKGKTA